MLPVYPYLAMSTTEAVTKFREKLRNLGIEQIPDFHVVLGSGFGTALDQLSEDRPNAWITRGEISFAEIPTLSASTTPDHAGKYRVLKNEKTGKSVVVQMGRLHGYEGHAAKQVVQTVMIPRALGVEKFVLTNAAGSLTADYRPGEAMVIRDQVNFTGQNPLYGPNPTSPAGVPFGPRFPDMSAIYDRTWRETLTAELTAAGTKTHEGVYIGVLGPSFETPAEVALFGRWNLHAVGMSTVWEAIALKHSGAKIAGLSLISNLGCGLGDGEVLDHLKILETCRISAVNIVHGLFNWIDRELNGK